MYLDAGFPKLDYSAFLRQIYDITRAYAPCANSTFFELRLEILEFCSILEKAVSEQYLFNVTLTKLVLVTMNQRATPVVGVSQFYIWHGDEINSLMTWFTLNYLEANADKFQTMLQCTKRRYSDWENSGHTYQLQPKFQWSHCYSVNQTWSAI